MSGIVSWGIPPVCFLELFDRLHSEKNLCYSVWTVNERIESCGIMRILFTNG